MRWAGYVARMGEKRNAYRILVGKPEGKRPLGRPRRTWVDNIKIDLKEIGWDGEFRMILRVKGCYSPNSIIRLVFALGKSCFL
jgi:hypothetical protein